MLATNKVPRMQKRLVPFDGTRFLKIDKVALARTAQALLVHLPSPDAEDGYGIHRVLKPLLEKAITGCIESPLLERQQILSGRYFFERMEGTLSPIFTEEFNTALSRFLVRALALPLDPPIVEVIDGQPMAWFEFEEPGDWPLKVRHQ